MIKIKDVSFTYKGSKDKSLSNINMDIKQGEIVLITGRSGCGKSTIIKCINGLIPSFYEGDLEGGIILDGKDISTMKTYQIARLIGTVFQDPRSQFFSLDTSSELAFTCENFGIHSKDIKNRIREAVEVFKIEHLLEKSIFKISSGEKQRIAIASAYTLKPKVFLFDEPSANLDLEGIEDFKKALSVLKSRGHTVVISEHRLHYLKDVLDHAIYLKDGKIERKFSREEFLNIGDIERMNMGLRMISDKYNIKSICNNIKQIDDDKNIDENLTLKDISFRHNKENLHLKDVNLNASYGDIIAIIGKNGAGKSTLGKVLCGIEKKFRGDISLNKKKVDSNKRKKITSFVMQDTDYQLFTESVNQELILGNENIKDVEKNIEYILEKMNIEGLRDKHPASLSGGQKQRVTISSSIVKNPNIIIMDEPTSGLDLENMVRVSEIVKEVSRDKKILFIITHDIEFILNTCNKIEYIEKGKVTDSFEICFKNQEKILKCFEKLRGSEEDER